MVSNTMVYLHHGILYFIRYTTASKAMHYENSYVNQKEMKTMTITMTKKIELIIKIKVLLGRKKAYNINGVRYFCVMVSWCRDKYQISLIVIITKPKIQNTIFFPKNL